MNHNLYEVINTEIQQFYTQAKWELTKSMAYKIYAYISLTYTEGLGKSKERIRSIVSQIKIIWSVYLKDMDQI